MSTDTTIDNELLSHQYEKLESRYNKNLLDIEKQSEVLKFKTNYFSGLNKKGLKHNYRILLHINTLLYLSRMNFRV
jgi:hypothetical protein